MHLQNVLGWVRRSCPSFAKRCSGAALTRRVNNATGTLVRRRPPSDMFTSPLVAEYNVNYVTVIEAFGGFISSACANKYLAPPRI